MVRKKANEEGRAEADQETEGDIDPDRRIEKRGGTDPGHVPDRGHVTDHEIEHAGDAPDHESAKDRRLAIVKMQDTQGNVMTDLDPSRKRSQRNRR